jgi:hypothetical protein
MEATHKTRPLGVEDAHVRPAGHAVAIPQDDVHNRPAGGVPPHPVVVDHDGHGHPVIHEANNRPGRGFLVGILTSIAFIFWLIAMTTPIAMLDYGDGSGTTTTGSGTQIDQPKGKLHVDPWHACNRRESSSVAICRPMGHEHESCTQTRDMFRVEQAFLLLTGLMLMPLLGCAAVDFSHKLDARTPPLPFGLSTHGWTIFFAVCTALMSLVAFALGFAIPRSDPCNDGALIDQPDFNWGPSPVFSLLIFIFSLIIIVIALVLREDGSTKTAEEIKHPHHPRMAAVRGNEPLAA